MRSVIQACSPRDSILKGTFNPEVFTAAIGPVIDFYRTGKSTIDMIYTDGTAFFRDATYPTSGLKRTVSSVFRRIAGDATAPSIYRLETSFGGGKTHSLIACVHIAQMGKKLTEVTKDIIAPEYLPEPDSVCVVGIAGDEIPVSKMKGEKLIPYTLWGELAYQVGGQELYRSVKQEAESFAAPGKNFLEQVIGNRKMLILLDELAQYAARLDVAVPDGASQLAAFLMTLNGYAKQHDGVAIIVTLAGASDAFSRQTERLTKTLNAISSVDYSQDDAQAIAERAAQSVASVTMRDATAVTPVQASEISSVLAKRLFTKVDRDAAKEAMQAYCEMYSRNSSMLPEEATSVRFQERMVSNYPFHPTLIDFLNQKLAQSENFQGTRGVLRVLAMTVRSIWSNHSDLTMIHTCDIDVQNAAIVSELLGRTNSADLQLVLNADIGSADSKSLQGGLSNAQRADMRNPHPDHVPLYELTWKTVFLNSLVGRAEGNTSKLFGITEKDATFAVATPVVTPPQVHAALEEINESAFYLRYEDGKYFAKLDPTINSVLAMIRQTIDGKQIRQQLRSIVNSMITSNNIFTIENDVHTPQDIADNRDKPAVAIISLDADEIDPRNMFQQKGDNRPRERQNMLVLLVPKTVKVIGNQNEQMVLAPMNNAAADAWQRLETIACQVLAIKALESKPQSYGISAAKLQDNQFVSKKAERNQALATAVTEMYTGLYFAENGATITRKEIKPAVGEGGAAIMSQIIQTLKDSGKLLTADKTAASDLQSLASSYFFQGLDMAKTEQLLQNFFCYRSWPILASKDVLQTVLSQGVEKGSWVAYKMSDDPEQTMPAELYTQEKHVPMDVSLLSKGYSIMRVDGAKKRGWLGSDKVPPEKIREAVNAVLQNTEAATVHDICEAVKVSYANVEQGQIEEQLQKALSDGKYAAYQGEADQTQKPVNLIDGFQSAYHPLAQDEVIISRKAQSERGWLTEAKRTFHMDGNDGAKKVFPLLKRLGSLYTRNGATSVISSLDITDMQLPSGATMRVSLENLQPADVKRLDELFQVLSEAVKMTKDTEADIEIAQPDENDALIRELKK